MSTLNEIELLMGLGLTLCQTRVYLALCRFGMLNAKKLSKCANTARQDVYRITVELEELGLVEKIISTPIAFRAIPLDEGVTILLERRKETTRRLETKSRIFLKKFQISNKKEPPREKPEFVLVPAKEAVIHKINESIQQAQSSIDVVSSWKRFSHIMLFSKSLEKAWSRGVKCRFISEKPEEGKSLESFTQFCRKTNLCEVKFIPHPPSPIMAIYDEKEILLIVDPKAGISESSALWSNNPSIMSALEDYFDILWITAMETQSYGLDGKKVLRSVKQINSLKS